jgi:NTP pyrophosphatase (non-canonical NTP hydrolase)
VRQPERDKLMEIRDIQRRAWANKVAKGFNTSDIALEFGLLTAEVGEAFTAWVRRLPDLGEELADVLIYLVALAEMTGIDLDAETARKMSANEQRVYQRNERGVLVRVRDS